MTLVVVFVSEIAARMLPVTRQRDAIAGINISQHLFRRERQGR